MIDIESHEDCLFDYVEIRSGIQVLKRLCGNNVTDPIITDSNKMEVVFHSDASEQGKGFKAVYQTGKAVTK